MFKSERGAAMAARFGGGSMRRESEPMTLLEAARLDVKGELREDLPAKLDFEGLGFSADLEIARKAPTSPTSPIKHAVAQSLNSQPKVAIVHRVRLRNFDEKGEPARMIARHNSNDGTSGSPPDVPAYRTRSNSVPRNVGSSSSTRPQSAGATVRSSSVVGCDISTDAPKVRNLSSQEVAERGKDAAEWFRASRSINQKIRSIEDTETLLSMARERRASTACGAPSLNIRRKSKQIPLGDAPPSGRPPAIPTTEKEPPVKEVRKRRTVDAAALWGAKPVRAKKEPEEEAKPEVLAALDIGGVKKTCMRGAVTVGETGENGLLARLRRRKTVD